MYFDDVYILQATMLYMDAEVQQAIKYSTHMDKGGYTKLKWTHVEGAFALLVFGIALGTVCFVFELLIYKISYFRGYCTHYMP